MRHHHLAILRKSSGLLEKIISGDKKIESRWHSTRRAPWNTLKQGDTIFFKYSGGPVKAKAAVDKVLQLSNLSTESIKKIWDRYGRGIGLESEEVPTFLKSVKNKRYHILIFLEEARIIQEFGVDKAEYGNATAWIKINDIGRIKKRGRSRLDNATLMSGQLLPDI